MEIDLRNAAAGERADNASVQTEEQAMQAKSAKFLKKTDESDILGTVSKTSDIMIFTDKATEAVLRASHKDEKHTPLPSKTPSVTASELKQENSISHKDQKSDTPLKLQLACAHSVRCQSI